MVGCVAPPEWDADVLLHVSEARDPPLTSSIAIDSSRPKPLLIGGVGGGGGVQLSPRLCLSIYLPLPGTLPPAQGCCVQVWHRWWMSLNATSDRRAWPRILSGLCLAFAPPMAFFSPLRSIFSQSCSSHLKKKAVNERISHLGWLNVCSIPVETLLPAILNLAEAFGRRLGQGPFQSLPTDLTHLHVWQWFKELNEASERTLLSEKTVLYIFNFNYQSGCIKL